VGLLDQHRVSMPPMGQLYGEGLNEILKRVSDRIKNTGEVHFFDRKRLVRDRQS